MKVKRYPGSPYCWLTFRIRIPYDYVEKLRYICWIYKYRTIETFITKLVCEKIEAEEETIEEAKRTGSY